MPRVDSGMVANRDEWKRLALAHVRRYTSEQDDQWHLVALGIARRLLALLERTDVLESEFVPLLVEAGNQLPAESGADSLRRTLVRCYLESASPTAPRPLQLADLAIEPHGHLCVIVGRTKRPSRHWLTAQDFEPVRDMAEAPWWGAWLLTGGAVAVPEPLLFSVGRPSEEHLLELVAHSKPEQVKELLRLFPHLSSTMQR